MTYAPNVLLLDQDQVLRRATALLLSNRGACVSAAATLDDAISLARDRVYDVALNDLTPTMPGAREVLRRLRRDGLVPRRIVFCTGEPLTIGDAEVSSFSETLLKPYPFDQLLESIFGRRGARRRTRSGVFPRLRLVCGGAASAAKQRAAGSAAGARADRPSHVAPAAHEDERPRGAPAACGATIRTDTRGERKARGPAERPLRAPRRAQRGWRHPG